VITGKGQTAGIQGGDSGCPGQEHDLALLRISGWLCLHEARGFGCDREGQTCPSPGFRLDGSGIYPVTHRAHSFLDHPSCCQPELPGLDAKRSASCIGPPIQCFQLDGRLIPVAAEAPSTILKPGWCTASSVWCL